MNTDKTGSTVANEAIAGSELKSAVPTGAQPIDASEGDQPEIDETAAAELEDAEPANIEDAVAEPDVPFDKLIHKSRRLSDERVRGILESLLFASDKPLSANDVHSCTGLDRPRIQAAMEVLAGVHREGVHGTVLYEVDGGWQLRTDPANAEYVRRLLKVKPQRLTRAAVETLAIIAYRQPVTRPEVEDIRGVDSGAVVKALLDRKLIKILGRKEEVGRPILYGTTREFLEFFALKDLASLPTLREFQELSQEHREMVEEEPPVPPPPLTALDAPARAAVEALGTDSDAALVELEQAIASADERSKAAAGILDSAQPSPEEPESPPSPR